MKRILHWILGLMVSVPLLLFLLLFAIFAVAAFAIVFMVAMNAAG